MWGMEDSRWPQEVKRRQCVEGSQVRHACPELEKGWFRQTENECFAGSKGKAGKGLKVVRGRRVYGNMAEERRLGVATAVFIRSVRMEGWLH